MSLPPPDRPRAVGRPQRWLPPALWAAALLTATSWPNPDVPHVATHADKLVHAAMYAGLAFLVARAAPSALRRAAGAAAIVLATAAFGAADEWHQQFIPGRSASVEDWLADGVGAALGVALARARRVHPA